MLRQQIVEREKAEAALKESEGRYRLLIENAVEAILVIQREILAFANRRFVEITGYSPVEITSRPFIEFIHPEDRPAAGGMLLEVLEQGQSETVFLTFRLLTHEGGLRWIEFKPVRIEWAGAPALLAFCSDVTDAVMAELVLREKEEELREQAKKLEEANIGLKILLQHRQEEKAAIQESVQASITKLIMPFVDKLKRTFLSTEQATYLNIIEVSLSEIVSPFTARLSSNRLGLTPTELEVANLVKNGNSIKRISELLNISENAVRFHRQNIRRKLGLKHKKINLRSFLQQTI
ncbi:MAG: PAS domain S-box protein [Thermodesulfobacteriota bacterium]